MRLLLIGPPKDLHEPHYWIQQGSQGAARPDTPIEECQVINAECEDVFGELHDRVWAQAFCDILNRAKVYADDNGHWWLEVD